MTSYREQAEDEHADWSGVGRQVLQTPRYKTGPRNVGLMPSEMKRLKIFSHVMFPV